MLQSTPVLPSNASPLRRGIYYPTHLPRALQEQSANARQSSYQYSTHGFKYPVPNINENVWSGGPVYPSFQQPIRHPRIEPTPYQRRTCRSDRPRDFISNVSFQEGPEIVAAELLVKRMSRFPKYKTYRDRIQKMAHDDEKNVWPDYIHFAFLRGLIRYNPRGKKAVQYKNANMGRNELIADHIMELTGQDRPRKKVSSHIQTLKKMFDDPSILRFFQEDKDSVQSLSTRQRSTRHASQYPISSTYPRSEQRNSDRLFRLENDLNAFLPVEFEMFVQRKIHDAEGQEDHFEKRHCYTRTTAESVIESAAVLNWQTEFPLLAQMHRQKPLDCNVILGGASIQLPNESAFKDDTGTTLSGIELGISLRCTSNLFSHSPPKVWYRNSFYYGKDRLPDFSSDEPQPVLWAPTDGEEKCLATQLRFGSTFWANTLGMLANKLQSGAVDNNIQEVESEEQKYVRRYLEQISVLQEVMTETPSGPRRLLIILWHKFCPTSGEGSTLWNMLDLCNSNSSTQYLLGQIPIDSQYSSIDNVSRKDMLYADSLQNYGIPESSQQHQPFLQSPFEYESSAESGTSATTWPSISSSHEIAASEPYSATTTESFDFEGGNINLTYGSGLDFSQFDDAAFSFELPAGAGGSSSLPYQNQIPLESQQNWNYGFDITTASGHPHVDTSRDTELRRALYEHATSYHPETREEHTSFGAAESFAPDQSNDMEVEYAHAFLQSEEQNPSLSYRLHDGAAAHKDSHSPANDADDLHQFASPTHSAHDHSTSHSPLTVEVQHALLSYASPSTQYEHQAYAGAVGSHRIDDDQQPQPEHHHSRFQFQQNQQDHEYEDLQMDDQQPTRDRVDDDGHLDCGFQDASALNALAAASSYMTVAPTYDCKTEYEEDVKTPESHEGREVLGARLAEGPENQGLHDSNTRSNNHDDADTFSRPFQP